MPISSHRCTVRAVLKIVTVFTVWVGLIGSVSAAPPKIREVRLKTFGGKICILGLEVTARAQRSPTLKRYKVEVLDKKTRKWRIRRKDALIRAHSTGGKSRILDRMERKALYRYTLVDRGGRTLTRSRIGKLSKFPLCSRVADDRADSGANGTGGGTSTLPTPRPTQTPTPIPTAAQTPPPPTPTYTPTATPTPLPTEPMPICGSVDELFQQWGGPGICDIDGSGMVDADDLGLLLNGIREV